MAVLKSYIVGEVDAGMRLDLLLASIGAYKTRSAAVRAIKAKAVCVNGNCMAKSHVVSTGETIVYEASDAETAPSMCAQDIPLDVRFEDDDILVLSKQAGLVCHPAPGHSAGTLVHALINHCGAQHLCNVQGSKERLGIVHRLDMDTTGLMLAAKTNAAGASLMASMKAHIIERHYIALVHGIIAHDTGMINAPIARSETERLRRVVKQCEGARQATTTFTVLERFSAGAHDAGYTLIDCKLFSGRTHQIRVHMEYIKHPVVGDATYNATAPKTGAANFKLGRQFLHSYKLGFNHPISGEELLFFDNPTADLCNTLKALAARSTGKTQAGIKVANALAQAPHPSAPAFTDKLG